LEAARQHRPDLILLDVTMPVMDGRQCLAELRKDDVCTKIPVIMLTAESGRDIVMELAKLGVTGYIVKPFQQETFDKEVSKVLGAPGAAAAKPAATEIDAAAVLVVDDSEKVLDLARSALASSMTVLTALGGRAAVEQYKQTRPGIVVIDLEMPDMDGYATLQELQKLGKSTFVALTLRGDTASQEQAKKAGYHAVIEKPFQGADLLDKLKTLVGGAASNESLLRDYVGEHDGCAVFQLPDARNGSKIVPQLVKQLRVLANDGTDKLILDLAGLSDVGGDQMTALARLLAEAETLGIRTAICAPNQQVVTKLQQIAETKNAPYAASRDEARGSLQ
jgi:two-component system cell cycle response regulator